MTRITQNAVSAPLNLAVADFNLDGSQDIARAIGDGTFGLMEIANSNGGGRYRPDLSWSRNPQMITVRSNLGGSASRTVTLKQLLTNKELSRQSVGD